MRTRTERESTMLKPETNYKLYMHLYSLTKGKKNNMLHYHDIILCLLPFVVYSWHAMNPAKSAARWMFSDTKLICILQMPVAMTMYTQKRGQEANCIHVKQVADAKKIEHLLVNLPLIRSSIIAAFACSVFKFYCNLMERKQEYKANYDNLNYQYKKASRDDKLTSKAFAPGVLSLRLGADVRRPTYTCPKPPFPSFLSSL
jgi:hypothetical protein